MNLSTKKNKQYLLHEDPKPGRFYNLPKSHKVNNPSRPIVSSNNQPTECISQFVDFHRQTLGLHYTVIRQRYHWFLNKLTAIDILPDNALLVSLDVTSLYTNIPHNERIDACRFFLQKRTNKHIPTETICDLIRIILTMNNFTFNSKHYLQNTAPLWARLWLLPTLICFLVNLNATLSLTSPINHTCGLDLSTIFSWSGLQVQRNWKYLLIILHSTIKFTCSHLPSNIPFLDVRVSVKDGSIETDLYTKPTGKRQYLLVSSSHPQHTKRAIPFSLALRLRRICSNPDNYKLRRY